MTVVNLRGTSGSGKSHLVRRVVEHYDFHEPFYVIKRARPYFCVYRKDGHKPLLVPGHYEATCGGCDTVPTYDEIFNMVVLGSQMDWNVLYEGLLISAEVVRTAEAIRMVNDEYHIIAIDIPLEECLESVNSRRLKSWEERCRKVEAKNQKLLGNRDRLRLYTPSGLRPMPKKPNPVNPRATSAKYRGVKLSLERLSLDSSIQHYQHWLSREEAYQKTLQLLGLENAERD